MPFERAVVAPTTYRHDDLERLCVRSYGGIYLEMIKGSDVHGGVSIH